MKLKMKDYIAIFIGIVVAYYYLEVQKLFLPQAFWRPAMVAAYLVIFLALFYVIDPEKPYALSKWMSIWLTVVAACIIIVLDIMIKHIAMARLMRGVPVILGTTLIAPYIAGYLYGLMAKKK
jgi:hypothetical protein